MWKLKEPTSEELEYYFCCIYKDVKTEIDKHPYICYVLGEKLGNLEDCIRKIIISPPDELYDFHNDVMKALISNYKWDNLKKYNEIKRKTKNITQEEMIIKNCYSSVFEELFSIFDYDKIVVKRKDLSYWLTDVKGSDSCVYCNRQYTLTIKKNKGNPNKQYVVRPALDHWFSHELFPLLSLSFYNLIPSCTVCNSGLKGTKTFLLDTHINPYLQKKYDPDFKFSALGCAGNRTISVITGGDERVSNTLEDLKIEEVYQYHADKEVKDIMDFNEMSSSGYLKELYSIVLSDSLHAMSKIDAYEMLFGTKKDPEEFSKRPFSKLKSDLLKQIGVIE